MGKVASRLTLFNPLRDYNIENRAHKAISNPNRTAAPKHKVDALNYERILKEHPNIVEETKKKHTVLDERLRDVFVKSTDTNPEIPRNPTKPLPADRHTYDFEYGFREPDFIPKGRVTLRNVLKFLTDHQQNKHLETPEKISTEYSLPVETVQDILKHYNVFEVYVPIERNVKARFAGPTRSRTKIHLENITVPRLTKKSDAKEDT